MSELFDEMKQANPAEVTYSVGVTPVLILGISDFRVAAVICAPIGGEMRMSFRPDPTSTTGMTLPINGSPLTLTVSLHGRMVRGPIWATCPGGAENITVWEAIHPCACLRGN